MTATQRMEEKPSVVHGCAGVYRNTKGLEGGPCGGVGHRGRGSRKSCQGTLAPVLLHKARSCLASSSLIPNNTRPLTSYCSQESPAVPVSAAFPVPLLARTTHQLLTSLGCVGGPRMGVRRKQSLIVLPRIGPILRGPRPTSQSRDSSGWAGGWGAGGG